MTWVERKAKMFERINTYSPLFLNPRKDQLNWQAGMELVGEGKVTYDCGVFTMKEGAR